MAIGYFLKSSFVIAVIGGLVHLGLAALPPALEAQDRATCRLQHGLPGLPAVRQSHCERR
jgi:hypothetical protein